MRSHLEAEAGAKPQGVPVPDHELIRRIGRGSYGAVWLARNLMGVYRAVKVVYRESFDHQRPFERELAGIRKFEPISRSHESFVDILHVGQNENLGYFFYIMELGDDSKAGQVINPDCYVPKTLATEIGARGRLPWEECVQLGLSLTNGLEFLHKNGLVHRDVKPSNIIFVNRVAKLADIGLVADINEARSYVGTEGFIPPEGPGTRQADVYSLGKVLYEISTGKDRHEFPDLPARLEESADLDRFLELNEVILQACKNEATKRYQTAWDMHAALVVLANGQSLKRLRLLEERFSTIKKIAGISAVVIVALAVLFYQLYREWNFVREGRQRQIGAEVAHGTRAMEEGDLLKSLSSFAVALQLDRLNADREKTHRLRLRAVMEQAPKMVQMWFGDHEINEASFSPDGKRLLVIESLGKARIFEVATGEPVGAGFGQISGLAGGAWHPSGKWVATASYDGTATVWDINTGEQTLVLSHPDRVFSAVFSADGSRIVTACKDHVARIWNFPAGAIEVELRRHTAPVLYATFSHDGRFVVTTSRDNTAQIWNATTGEPVGSPLQHRGWVNHASFSPDDHKVVTVGSDHRACVWEVGSNRRLLSDLKHGDAVMSAHFSPDGLMVLTASLDGNARLWDADSMQPVALNPILWHGSRLLHASFAPDGHRIATACSDGTTCIWDLAGSSTLPVSVAGAVSQDGTRLLVKNNGTFRVLDTASMKGVLPDVQLESPLVEASLSCNGRFVLSVTAKNEGTSSIGKFVRAWDCSTGTCISSPITVTGATARVSICDDGRQLVAYTEKGAQLWRVADGRPSGSLMVHEEPVSGAVLSSDGRRLAILAGSTVSLWDTSSRHQVCRPLRQSLPVNLVQFSPDASVMVTACKDDQLNPGEARLWNSVTGTPIGLPLVHRDGILCVAFSRDGHRIMTGSEDFTAVVWDVATGRPIGSPLRHNNQVNGVSFSPDGLWVATASADRTARIWDTLTGEPVTPPLLHPAVLQSAAFSSDSQTLITADKDGQVWCWDLHTDRRPSEDLLWLSQLITGLPGTTSQPNPRTREERRATWQRLRAQYPADFSVPQQKTLAWHLRYSQFSQAEHQWRAALFHLNYLLTLNPQEAALLDQLKKAQFRCSEQEHR